MLEAAAESKPLVGSSQSNTCQIAKVDWNHLRKESFRFTDWMHMMVVTLLVTLLFHRFTCFSVNLQHEVFSFLKITDDECTVLGKACSDTGVSC